MFEFALLSPISLDSKAGPGAKAGRQWETERERPPSDTQSLGSFSLEFSMSKWRKECMSSDFVTIKIQYVKRKRHYWF